MCEVLKYNGSDLHYQLLKEFKLCENDNNEVIEFTGSKFDIEDYIKLKSLEFVLDNNINKVLGIMGVIKQSDENCDNFGLYYGLFGDIGNNKIFIYKTSIKFIKRNLKEYDFLYQMIPTWYDSALKWAIKIGCNLDNDTKMINGVECNFVYFK